MQGPLNLMKYLQVYLTCTILLYFLGPVEWQTHHTVLTFGLDLFTRFLSSVDINTVKTKDKS